MLLQNDRMKLLEKVIGLQFEPIRASKEDLRAVESCKPTRAARAKLEFTTVSSWRYGSCMLEQNSILCYLAVQMLLL